MPTTPRLRRVAQSRGRVVAALGVLLSAALAACDDDPAVPEPGSASAAIVRFVFTAHPADTLSVLVSDTTAVRAAQRYVQTGAGPHLLSGRIVKGAGTDARYPFHFLPESVQLVDLATEVCDAAPMHTASDVDAFFELSTGNRNAPNAIWCPWDSRPIRVSLTGQP